MEEFGCQSTRPSYGLFILVPVFCVLFCFGFVLNITVIYITIKNDQLRDRYVLLASISTAHIVVCVFLFPLAIAHHVTSEVIISRVCEFLTCFVVNVASFTMSVIAVRRALALSENFRYKIGEFTYESKQKAIVAVWICAFCVSTPFIFDACKNNSPFSVLLTNCGVQWISEGNNSVNNGNDTSLISDTAFSEETEGSSDRTVVTYPPKNGCYWYSLVLVISCVYVGGLVSMILQAKCWRDIAKRPNQKLWEKELMITKQHLVMLIVFLLCWSPLILLHFLGVNEYGVLYAFQSLALSSVVYNPVTYYFLNQNMRNDIQKLLNGVKKRVKCSS